jgi:hypothetical protein
MLKTPHRKRYQPVIHHSSGGNLCVKRLSRPLSGSADGIHLNAHQNASLKVLWARYVARAAK